MLGMLAEQAEAVGRIPAWGMWAAGVIGVSSLVFAVLRNARRLARASGGDAPLSEPQRRWNAGRAPQGSAAARADAAELEELSQRVGRQTAELRELIARADERLLALRGLSKGETGAGRAPASGAERATRGAMGDPSARVCTLADDGLSPAQIAAETGRSVSEISLILALR